MLLKIILPFLFLCSTLHSKQSSVLRSLSSSASSKSSLLSSSSSSSTATFKLKPDRRQLLKSDSTDSILDTIFSQFKDIDVAIMDELEQQLKAILNDPQFQSPITLSLNSNMNHFMQMSMYLEMAKVTSGFVQNNKENLRKEAKKAKEANELQANELSLAIDIFDTLAPIIDLISTHKQELIQIFTEPESKHKNIHSMLKHKFNDEQINKVINTLCESIANSLPVITKAMNQATNEDELVLPAQIFVKVKKENLVKLIRNVMDIVLTVDADTFHDEKAMKQWLFDDKFKDSYIIIKDALGEQKARKLISEITSEFLTEKEREKLIKHYEGDNGMSTTIIIIIIVSCIVGVVLIGITVYFCRKKKNIESTSIENAGSAPTKN